MIKWTHQKLPNIEVKIYIVYLKKTFKPAVKGLTLGFS